MADPQALTSGYKPGDKPLDLHSMLRVDHAGEYGATRIYAGQLAVLRGGSRAAHLVAHMASQEERHLARFNQLLTERRVRPTLLQPLWHVGGFALGAMTALISEKAARPAPMRSRRRLTVIMRSSWSSSETAIPSLPPISASSRPMSWSIAIRPGRMARWRHRPIRS
jgi:hypothetical protein